MLRPLRNLLANFSVTISLVTASALAAVYSSDTNLRMLSVDADFAPNLALSDGSKRPWIVNPMGIDRDFPAWGIAYAILPAALLFLEFMPFKCLSIFRRNDTVEFQIECTSYSISHES